MTTITIEGAGINSELQQILDSDEIVPGSNASYQICKLLWTCHVLGGKIVEKPVALALSKPRLLSVPCSYEEDMIKAFTDEWERLGATNHIRDVMHISRAYGAGAVAYGFPETPTDQDIDPFALAIKPGLYFNTFDPLNLSGSIVTNQNPNAPDFQKPNRQITAAGQPYAPSRTCTVFHGTPIYLDFQGSSFSFSGRSVFLRILYPLKSYIRTMEVNDMVSRKAGLLIAKVKQNGSVINNLMQKVTGIKRDLLKEGVTNQVLSIDPDEDIETLNMQNTSDAMTTARDNIISDCAAGADVPAVIIKDEAFAQGFANGDQDMLAVVQYIDGIREQMQSLFNYFDRIVAYRAWNEEFFETLKGKYEDSGLSDRDYKAWFYEMRSLFKATWPTLIQEPKSETIKRDSEKLKAMSDVMKTLAPIMSPANLARALDWYTEALNSMPDMFTAQMEYDVDEQAEYEPPQPAMGQPGGEGNGD